MKNMIVILICLLLISPLCAKEAASVDINAASAEEMDSVLLNIGPAKAQAIVEHRQAHGPFRSVEELALVKGIGLRTVERNRDRIVLGAGTPAAVRSSRMEIVKPVRTH